MPIDTEDALTFGLTGTPGATNQSVPTRPTNDRFGEILPIVGTAVMGAKLTRQNRRVKHYGRAAPTMEPTTLERHRETVAERTLRRSAQCGCALLAIWLSAAWQQEPTNDYKGF